MIKKSILDKIKEKAFPIALSMAFTGLIFDASKGEYKTITDSIPLDYSSPVEGLVDPLPTKQLKLRLEDNSYVTVNVSRSTEAMNIPLFNVGSPKAGDRILLGRYTGIPYYLESLDGYHKD